MVFKVTYFCYSKVEHLHFLMSLMILVLSNQKYLYTFQQSCLKDACPNFENPSDMVTEKQKNKPAKEIHGRETINK